MADKVNNQGPGRAARFPREAADVAAPFLAGVGASVLTAALALLGCCGPPSSGSVFGSACTFKVRAGCCTAGKASVFAARTVRPPGLNGLRGSAFTAAITTLSGFASARS